MNQDDIVYELSADGEHELRGGKTTLAGVEIELLVRINGQQTIGQIMMEMPAFEAQTLASALQNLIKRNLLSIVEPDPFASRFLAELDEMALALADPEAASGEQSLTQSGYYVSIARPRRPIRALAPGEKLTAVVVQSDPLLSKFIESYLTLERFQVRRAGNRAEILAELRKAPVPDLILLDVVLPDADGFDILRRLRRHATLKGVRVILLTAKATREDVLKGLASGADGYVTKPFEIEVLTRAVKTVMGLPDDTEGKSLPKGLWAYPAPRATA